MWTSARTPLGMMTMLCVALAATAGCWQRSARPSAYRQGHRYPAPGQYPPPPGYYPQPQPTYGPSQPTYPPPQPTYPQQPAPQPTYPQQPAPQPSQPFAPWLNMIGHLLSGGVPPLPPPGPQPAPQPAPEPQPAPAPAIDPRGVDLANAINRYRAQNGLPAIPISKSLSRVADTHVRDLRDSPKPAENCNGHSWSSRGPWTPCCYTPDHAQAKCMWNKPAEIAQFRGTGFEITIGQPGEVNAGVVLDSASAISAWQGSPLHNDVILNRGQWQSMQWRAMGAGIIDSHACAWFSDQADPTP
ncbi:MAG TPA: CAP domain-containing protein [Polyangiaceae bacterium]|nr:CAP domain-containing protein [Polyangiaceae bacterium]